MNKILKIYTVQLSRIYYCANLSTTRRVDVLTSHVADRLNISLEQYNTGMLYKCFSKRWIDEMCLLKIIETVCGINVDQYICHRILHTFYMYILSVLMPPMNFSISEISIQNLWLRVSDERYACTRYMVWCFIWRTYKTYATRVL